MKLQHIICQDCEKIVEFESDRIIRLEDEITQQLGFSIKAQRLQITGSCDSGDEAYVVMRGQIDIQLEEDSRPIANMASGKTFGEP